MKPVLNRAAVLAEVQKRAERAKIKKFNIEEYCFDEQYKFIRDPSKFKTAVCSRRAGKTEACAADLIDTALNIPRSNSLYITLSRTSAERIIWRTLMNILSDYQIKHKANNKELTIKILDTDSMIYISGAKDSGEIEKFRGMSLHKVYVDECFHPDTLIDTLSGPKKISEVTTNDYVKSALGFKKVTEVSKKQKKVFAKLSFNGNIIKCSLDHPFFTEHGWKKAKDLKIGDNLVKTTTAMQLLRNAFHETRKENLSFLQFELLREVESRKSSEPHAERECSRKNETNIEEKWTQTISERWKRSWANKRRKNDNRSYSGNCVELCNWIRKSWKRLSIKLQSRFSISRFKVGYRSGWEFSQPNFEKTTGFEKSRQIKYIRLDSIEIQESRSDSTNPEGYFYDIGVEGHPSFTVNEVLVHNCQSFKPYIKELVEDVLSWAMKDVSGTLCLTGTPGPIPAGYFYEMSTKKNAKVGQHKWTLLQNPWIKKKSGMDPEDILAEERARKGITESDPTYRREALGEWVKDDNALVFRFDPKKNIVSQFPTDLVYIFGVDIGFNDADAISVIGYNYSSNNVYLVEEVVQDKQDITTLVGKIKDLQAFYKPIKIVMDAGALGKKIQEEIRNRHGINAEAADKNRKLEYIELLNDDLRTGRFKTFAGSIFEQDSNILVWDYEGSVKKVSDRTHSDVCISGESKILTGRGFKKVSEMIETDTIINRFGEFKIKGVGITNNNAEVLLLTFSDNSELICTPKHKIYTKNRGFIEAKDLTSVDQCINIDLWEKTKEKTLLGKLLNLMGLNFIDTHNQKENTCKTTFQDTIKKRELCYIELFGNFIMDLFQKGMLFTIKTEILKIIIQKISNVCLRKSILENISIKKLQKNQNYICLKCKNWQKNGTVVQKVLNGIENMLKIGKKKIERKLKKTVQFVTKNILKTLWHMEQKIFVLQSVLQKTEEILVKIMKLENVNFVKKNIQQINIVSKNSAVGLVIRKTLSEKDTVYNITVDGPPEYFANNILIRNCDSTLYAFREAKHYFEKTAEKKLEKYSKDWLDEQEKLLAQKIKAQNTKEEEIVSQEDMDYIFENDEILDGISDSSDDWY